MAKYGISKNVGLKICGMLDIRMDEGRVYVDVEEQTFSLAQLLEEYDGQDVVITTGKEILPDGLVDESLSEED